MFMWRKQAERFEASLQQAARDENPEEPYHLLVKTANSVSAIDVPPPPRGLVEGRRQLAAEASQLRFGRSALQGRLPLFAGQRLRLVPVLASLLIVLALLPLFVQEVAASLPGSPLYGLKLLTQDLHSWVTSSPDAQADLDVSLAERRLNDVATALEQGHNIDDTAAQSAEKQLSRAMQTVAQNPETAGAAAPLQLLDAVQNCERVMVQALDRMSESDQMALRDLLRQMERVRQELHSGAGTASGEQGRAQYGDPPSPEEMPWGLERPDPGWRWPESPGQGAGVSNPGAPGQPAQTPQQQQGAASAGPAGPAQATATPTPATPAPNPTPEQGQQQGGEQQPGPGGNDPGNNSSPGNKSNSGHSGHP
ncbi:MAG: DUF5667 domain-containing protein [Anaerolineae bacterium]